jgi:hypothetical protein
LMRSLICAYLLLIEIQVAKIFEVAVKKC